ncbi:hypothetical protein ACLMJK_001199 [Lecanora helva]
MEGQPSLLVSGSATPFVPETLSPEERSTESFTLPSSQQQAAIFELQEYSEEEIFAWLSILRSLAPGFEYRNGVGGLSHAHFSAISSLKDCSNRNIIIWLQCVTLSGESDLRTRWRHCSIRLLKICQATSIFALTLDDLHLDPQQVSLRGTPEGVQQSTASDRRQALLHPQSTVLPPVTVPQEALQAMPEAASENDLGHTHWCYECGKTVDSCDGWKRHMKEHETYFPCMPFGPIEYHEDVPSCALCGLHNPKRDHLASHRVAPCWGGSKAPTRKSRKSLLVNHLASHGVHDTAASDLAENWQVKRGKQAFSCGFCVQYFPTITEQLNHIDNEHYKKGHDKLSWSISTVIQGLLHQPKVHKYWRRLLASDTQLNEASFQWAPETAETLQAKLELGHESGSDLALTAFGSHNRADHSASVTLPILQHMAVDPSATMADPQAVHIHEPPTHGIRTIAPATPEGTLFPEYQPNTSPFVSLKRAGAASYSTSLSCPSTGLKGHCSFPGWDNVTPKPEVFTIGNNDDFSHGHAPWHDIPPVGSQPWDWSLLDDHTQSHEYMDRDKTSSSAHPPYFDSVAHSGVDHPSQHPANADHSSSSRTVIPTQSFPENQNSSPRSWEKPLPALPTSADEIPAEPRSRSPMDIDSR